MSVAMGHEDCQCSAVLGPRARRVIASASASGLALPVTHHTLVPGTAHPSPGTSRIPDG